MIGEVALFPYSFVPQGYLSCDGQLVSQAQYPALFAILGTTYGGGGGEFALPNLNGRAAVGTGQGPGLSNYPLGAQGGQEQVTLQEEHLPRHTHSTLSVPGTANSANPAHAAPAMGAALYGPQPTAEHTLTATGAGQPHNNMQPSLVLSYCIAVQGVFPLQS